MNALFPELIPARRKPRKLMHALDAGDPGVRFMCRRCKHETDWVGVAWNDSPELADRPVSEREAKRGIPCPFCDDGETRPALADDECSWCRCAGCDPDGAKKTADEARRAAFAADLKALT